MSVYLYNLMFSLTGSNVNVGSFEPYPSPLPPSPNIANLSCAWFTASSSPPGLQPYFQVMSHPLSASLWGSPQSDANDLTLHPGDYLMLRVFRTPICSTTRCALPESSAEAPASRRRLEPAICNPRW